MPERTYVIAAGGTAGHVVPALAVADELRADGARVVFVGGERAERELVPAAGYELRSDRRRGPQPQQPAQGGARAREVAGAPCAPPARILDELRPAAVLGGGGYVAGPVGLAAARRGIPLVLTEADSHLGLTNRLLARRARRVCLAFPIEGRDGARYLRDRPPGAAAGATDVARRARALRRSPERARVVLVFGGSLGARTINEAAIEAFARRRPGLPRAALRRRARPAGPARPASARAHYDLRGYVDDFAQALAAADLVVARAGGSVFEIAAAGRPAILVPYPHAAGDHQAGNARWMERAGAAVVVPDARADRRAPAPRGRRAARRPRTGLRRWRRASAALARPDAAREIAREVVAAGGGGPRDDDAVGGPALHLVGIGGAGMSGYATVGRRARRRRSAARTAPTRRRSSACAPPGSTPAPATTPRTCPARRTRSSCARPRSRPTTPSASRPRERGLRVVPRAELLRELSALRRTIAVAGAHGKTTTTSMVAHVLLECGLDPGYLIGGELRTTGARRGWGEGEWLVVEADESDRSMLALDAEVAVVTNVELDHHATYGSLEELREVFREFLARPRRRSSGTGPSCSRCAAGCR